MGLFARLRNWVTNTVITGVLNLVRGGFTFQNNSLASNETIFSAISMLSGAIASLPIALKREALDVQPGEHTVANLLEWGPCPNMSTFQFIRCMEVLRNSTGAGYAIKELTQRGSLYALWLMRTENVTPMIDRDSRELYYQVRDHLGSELAYLHHSMVLAVNHISNDGINPINPIEVLRSTLDYDREVKEFSINQMQNGLRANYAVTFPKGNLNKEQIERYDEMVKTFKKSGILYLDAGKEIKELNGLSVIDPKVFEVENITIARVARVYNLPLDKFLPEKTSYSSAEQSDLNYLRDTILPMARMYEQEFSRKLLTEQERAAGMKIKFSLNGFARADMKTRGDFYFKGVRSGWFCLDEIRDMEDRPPIPGGYGKEFFTSKDLVPIRILTNASQTNTQGSDTNE